jgi:hypothetical protein
MMMHYATAEAGLQLRIPAIGSAVRWSALAIASLVVPIAMLGTALSAGSSPASLPMPAVAPVVPEAPVTLVSESVASNSATSTGESGALPSYYSFNWAEECETECPGRVAP